MHDKRAWVLVDERVGNVNQARALAAILQLNYEEKTLQYNKLAPFIHWPSWKLLKGNHRHLQESLPDIIISAGRRQSLIALRLKQEYKHLKLIQILRPSCCWNRFAAIVLPAHDYIQERPNIFPITVGLSNLPLIAEEDLALWYSKFNLSMPLCAVLIGGNSKNCHFKNKHIIDLCTQLKQIADNGYGLLVSTSRRTPPELVIALKAVLADIPHYLYLPDAAEPNPYHAYLNLADKIVVTGDSISMCSEAIQTNKVAYVYFQDDMISKKHQQFLSKCINEKLLLPLDKNAKFDAVVNNNIADFKPMIDFIRRRIDQ